MDIYSFPFHSLWNPTAELASWQQKRMRMPPLQPIRPHVFATASRVKSNNVAAAGLQPPAGTYRPCQ